MLNPEKIPELHIAIATPCYGGQVFQNYFMSIINLIFDANKTNLKLSFIIRGGDSLIPRTRNSIVAEFMATPQYTHLLWIDADIGFTVDQIYRLILADRDVVAGVYPLKKIKWPDGGVPAHTTQEDFESLYTGYPFNPIGSEATIDNEGFVEVLDAPTGMMMIKREALEKMIKAYPGLRYIADDMLGLEGLKDKIANYHYRFFDVMTEENGRYLSEDYAFCRRWQNIGGRIFVDVRSDLSHQGGHLYRGNLLKSLMANDAKHRAERDALEVAQNTELLPPIDPSKD